MYILSVAATQEGWTYDSATKYIKPTKPGKTEIMWLHCTASQIVNHNCVGSFICHVFPLSICPFVTLRFKRAE